MNNQVVENSLDSEALPPAISQIIESMRKDYWKQHRTFRTNKAVLIESVEDVLPGYNMSACWR